MTEEEVIVEVRKPISAVLQMRFTRAEIQAIFDACPSDQKVSDFVRWLVLKEVYD